MFSKVVVIARFDCFGSGGFPFYWLLTFFIEFIFCIRGFEIYGRVKLDLNLGSDFECRDIFIGKSSSI
jgi:hypothetical protein